jgi:ethanolaminephosphotransferase
VTCWLTAQLIMTILQFFPLWVAPNLITFSGFLLTVFNFLLFAYYDWDFTAANRIPRNNNITILASLIEDIPELENGKSPIPNWVFLLTSIFVMVAYTLDGIDGKQARRTGTSTPLGELFDHGLDSYSSLFIMIYLFSLFGTNDFPVMRMQFMTFCVYLNFYVSSFNT